MPPLEFYHPKILKVLYLLSKQQYLQHLPMLSLDQFLRILGQAILEDTLLDAQLLAIRKIDDHFTEIVQFLSTGMAPSNYTIIQKKKLVVRIVYFSLIAGQLYKMGPNEILRRCVMEEERPLILVEAHEGIVGGHYVGKSTTQNILRASL
jgi:hypothetical protein